MNCPFCERGTVKRKTYVFVGNWARGFVWCAPFESLSEAIANRLSAVEIRNDGKTVWIADGVKSVEQQLEEYERFENERTT